MGPADLEEIIGDIHFHDRADVLVGPGDDAGVHLIGDQALVETVDVITPVVNDPFTFGAISAANSISDVYAMGGRPLTALAIAGFPSCDYEPAVLREVIKGAVSTLKRAGAVLIGGHSFQNDEMKFGLSVTGVIDKERILRANTAAEGDVIIMTKPLGIGILTTALKGCKLTDAEMGKAIEWMLTLNEGASGLALLAKASACTDITGFGLLGHCINMLAGASLDFVIYNDRVPVMDKVYEMIDGGMVPEGAYHNLRFLHDKVEFPGDLSEERKLLLSDPQTSGGLLITMRQSGLEVFEKAGAYYAVIGKVVKGAGKVIVQ
ncbi:MAG: selenide, water dikinase SelD [Dissulfurispiraceae bacterium]